MRNFDRRSFLRFIGVLFATFSAPLLAPREAEAAFIDMLEQSLCQFFPDFRPATRIGRKYLARHPEIVDREELLMELFRRFQAAAKPPARQELLAELRLHIRDDFSHDRVTELDGWVLSETEGKLAAFLFLSKSECTNLLEQ